MNLCVGLVIKSWLTGHCLQKSVSSESACKEKWLHSVKQDLISCCCQIITDLLCKTAENILNRNQYRDQSDRIEQEEDHWPKRFRQSQKLGIGFLPNVYWNEMLRLLKLICFEILVSERDFSFYADLNDSVCLDSTFWWMCRISMSNSVLVINCTVCLVKPASLALLTFAVLASTLRYIWIKTFRILYMKDLSNVQS